MRALSRLTLVSVLATAPALGLVEAQTPARSQSPAGDGQRFQQALTLMETARDYRAAARLFEQVAAGPDRALASRALVYAGVCYERLGRSEAQRLYRRVLSDFSDQPTAVREARARLRAL